MRLVILLCGFAAIAAAQPGSINLSHDLTTLGIAAQNMTPDSPMLDSRPLLESAVAYAQAHSIPAITADRGSYYFLTGHPFGRFFSFQSLQNLIFDFNGSDLYFANGNWIGLECDGCNNVQFKNFTLDSLQLPFTQLRVTSVDTAAHHISYATIQGWEPATNFNQIRNPFGSAEPLYAFAFRNGAPLRSTGRMSVQRPIDPAFLTIASDGSPWSDPQQLSSIQPGDIIVLSARAGGPTLVARNGFNISISNVSIYFSGGVGVMLASCPNSTTDQVQIIPRPATDRLISTNADGISAVQLGKNLTIKRSRIRRTGDDGISPNSQQLAVVTGVPDTRHVTVNRAAYTIFANGTQVQFIDNKTGFPALTAHIVDQTPPYNPALPQFGSSATLTLDQDVPPLAVNDPMVYADPNFRGAGLVVENNLIEETLHARGMSLWGLLGGTIQSNVLRNLSWSAIAAIEQDSTATWMTGPVANMTIQGNAIEQFSTAFGSGVVSALAGIDIEADDLNFAPVAGSPLQNMMLMNNFVSTGPYSGLSIGNVNSATVTGNTAMNVSTNPASNHPATKQAINVAASTGVTSSGNLIDTTASAALVSSGVSASDEALAPNSWAKMKGTNLAPKSDLATTDPLPTNFDGVSVVITDSAGAFHMAPILYVSGPQINFLVPPDTALGAAVVTVTLNGSTVARGATLIDSLAPALFTTDGSGSGTALGGSLLIHPDGSYDYAPLTQPIDLGQSGDSATLVLFATAVRNLSSFADATAFFNGQRLPVQFAGDQGTYVGLDQVNIAIPASWRGAGQVNVRLVVDGFSSNVVTINIK
jgi:uncharacterized protein (TIGR03437 family)